MTNSETGDIPVRRGPEEQRPTVKRVVGRREAQGAGKASFAQNLSEKRLKRRRKTRNTLFSPLPTPVTGPPKPPLSAQNGEKQEKFGRIKHCPTVKRVVRRGSLGRLTRSFF